MSQVLQVSKELKELLILLGAELDKDGNLVKSRKTNVALGDAIENALYYQRKYGRREL